MLVMHTNSSLADGHMQEHLVLFPAFTKGPGTLGDFRCRIQDEECPTANRVGPDREGFRVQLSKPMMALEGFRISLLAWSPCEPLKLKFRKARIG